MLSLPEYVIDGDLRDELLEFLHLGAEEARSVHLTQSVRQVLQHKPPQTTVESNNKKITVGRTNLAQ